MLASVENIPHTPEQWFQWAFDHRDSHTRIRNAVLKQYGQALTDYQIEPINPNDIEDFLQNNSSLHAEMNTILGLQSTNLLDADLSDEKQLIAWIKFNYLEHYYAELKLGI